MKKVEAEAKAKGKIDQFIKFIWTSNEKKKSKGFINNNTVQEKSLDRPNNLINNIKQESKNLQADKDIGNKRALLWVQIKNNFILTR